MKLAQLRCDMTNLEDQLTKIRKEKDPVETKLQDKTDDDEGI